MRVRFSGWPEVSPAAISRAHARGSAFLGSRSAPRLSHPPQNSSNHPPMPAELTPTWSSTSCRQWPATPHFGGSCPPQKWSNHCCRRDVDAKRGIRKRPGNTQMMGSFSCLHSEDGVAVLFEGSCHRGRVHPRLKRKRSDEGKARPHPPQVWPNSWGCGPLRGWMQPTRVGQNRGAKFGMMSCASGAFGSKWVRLDLGRVRPNLRSARPYLELGSTTLGQGRPPRGRSAKDCVGLHQAWGGGGGRGGCGLRIGDRVGGRAGPHSSVLETRSHPGPPIRAPSARRFRRPWGRRSPFCHSPKNRRSPQDRNPRDRRIP